MTTIDKGEQSNMDDARRAAVRTDAEWKQLWRQHAQDRPRPSVDFGKQMVVGVFAGTRPSAGYAVEIVSAAQADGAVVVRYRESAPPKGALTAQVLTSPYHLVTVPFFPGDVEFEKVP